ncbi:MAG: hypothetical protein WBF09_03975 [Candidatus Acidiferrum sp.]
MAKNKSYPTRTITCQVCPWQGMRYFGKGILVAPCPLCGARVAFAVVMPGDPAVSLAPKLVAAA